MKTLALLVLIGLLVITSCSEELFEPTCTGITPTFAVDVQPIIASNCAISGCHNTGSTKGPGALTTYSQISNAKNSINTVIRNGSMPRNGSLTSNEKNLILCWIQNGAPNN